MTGSPASGISSREQDQDHREAEILSRHLDSNYTGGFDPGDDIRPSPVVGTPPAADGEQPSSLKLPGGDVHRDLYRIEARAKRARLGQRAQTFSYVPRAAEEAEEDEVSIANEPGSFRRQFVQQRKPSRFHKMTSPVTKNFVDFLDLYGSFAGEDLAESEEEFAIEEEVEAERRPLLGRQRTSKRFTEQGDASNVKSFFTLLKAFIGTGIMFLPKAFRNGGLLFSSITLVTVSAVTALCFHLLLECRRKVGGSYGEIGERIVGLRLRRLILFSITLSQLGFVCAGIIFTAENLYSFLKAVTHGNGSPLSAKALIAIQLVVLIPLAFIRNISKLGPAALLADVFILIGLTYIYSYDIATLASVHGMNPTVRLFNSHDFTLTVGSAIFTFEGIGLILPIKSSMKRPQDFAMLLYVVMFIITVIFTAVGALSYATFGDETRTEIITNFPQDNKLVNAVQFLYSMAVLVGTPVQLFPAVRIMEGKIFGHRSGKRDPSTKWKKNVFRTVIVVLCALIAVVGAGDLDKFVALIGSFAVSRTLPYRIRLRGKTH
jgi:solute carrier family 36 (proton-coupled amino acid transporter)